MKQALDADRPSMKEQKRIWKEAAAAAAPRRKYGSKKKQRDEAARMVSNKAADAEMQAWIAEAAERERLKEKT